MKTRLIKTILILFCVILDSVCCGCAASAPEKLENASIEHETELGGAYLHITIHDFLDLGFQFGDSVLVEFSNGYILEDIPFYNGYYVAADEPLLIGYPAIHISKSFSTATRISGIRPVLMRKSPHPSR